LAGSFLCHNLITLRLFLKLVCLAVVPDEIPDELIDFDLDALFEVVRVHYTGGVFRRLYDLNILVSYLKVKNPDMGLRMDKR